MRNPIILPLDNTVPRHIEFSRFPQGFMFPMVLQIEVKDEAEAEALQHWIINTWNILPDGSAGADQ